MQIAWTANGMNRFICALLIALVACIVLAFGDVPAVVKTIIGLPGAAALLIALWELQKGNPDFRRPTDAPPSFPDSAGSDDAFLLNATAYMSERAFDKHVEFCEAYIAKAYEALTCLFELGPSEKVVRRTTDLAQVRRQFALWESADVSLFLAEFEAALRDASAAGDHSHGVAGADRAEHLTEVFASLRRVLPLEESSEGATPEMATLRTIEILQEHLGIAQLTRLRQHHLAEGARRAESSQKMLEAP